MRWFLFLIKQVLPLVTPTLLPVLCELLHQFKEKAAETSNPWDDLLANLLYDMFCPDK